MPGFVGPKKRANSLAARGYLSPLKRTPGRAEGVRKIAKRFGVDPSTVQRISRPLDGVSPAGAGSV